MKTIVFNLGMARGACAIFLAWTVAGCAFQPPDSRVEPGFRPSQHVAGRISGDKNLSDAPAITARSAIIIDAESGRTLYEKNPDIRLPVASTQKLLTAMETIAEGDMERKMTVSVWDEIQPPTKLDLIAGTSYRKADLLAAMLVSSANDAASVIAGSGRRSYGKFIAAMNERAQRLGANHSLFLNPHGLDVPGQYSTARDSAIIAYYAYHEPLIRRITAMESVPFNYSDGRTTLLHNTNKLVAERPAYFNGLKSGFTELGGKCLVATSKYNGVETIIVMLDSTPNDIFRDAERLLKWRFKQLQVGR